MDKKITSTNSQQDEQKDRLSTAPINFQGFFGADRWPSCLAVCQAPSAVFAAGLWAAKWPARWQWRDPLGLGGYEKISARIPLVNMALVA